MDLKRIPEPDELMEDPVQARAYAEADFEEPHSEILRLFVDLFPDEHPGRILDLGCGTCDITWRFAQRYPRARIDAIDGAASMLGLGKELIEAKRLSDRINLILGYLPQTAPPRKDYDAVICNSLLHHLHDPAVLWDTARDHARPGAPIFVVDLMRPPSEADAKALVEEHAAGEHELLQRDFYNSLLASYRPDEVRGQLAAAGLDYLTVEPTGSGRHLMVHGRRA